jgi:hypothetical protein
VTGTDEAHVPGDAVSAKPRHGVPLIEGVPVLLGGVGGGTLVNDQTSLVLWFDPSPHSTRQ